MKKKIIITIVFVLIGLVIFNRTTVKNIIKKNSLSYSLAKKSKQIITASIPGFINSLLPEKSFDQVDIKINVSVTIETFEQFWGGFGNDYFYSGVTSDKNKAFFQMIKKANQKRKVFTFHRAHNIFSDLKAPNRKEPGGAVYKEDENGNPIYDWSRVDEVFDIILDAGMKPIVELGFMPSDLSSDKNRIGDWRKANVAPPKDYTKWQNLVSATLEHLISRYGEKEIKSWYFEVWNEPDLFGLFWIPDPNESNKSYFSEYCKLYDYTLNGLLSVEENISIGGPAVAGWRDFFRDFLNHCSNGNNYVTNNSGSRLDFYSFHQYGDVRSNIYKKTKKMIDTALDIDKQKFSQIPYLLDEFGPSNEFQGEFLNTSYVAAWTCQAIDAMFELGSKYGSAYRPAMMVFWSEIGENFKYGKSMLATTVGDRSYDLVKGPVFNIYEILSYLRNERLSFTGSNFGDPVHGIAAKQDDESVSILLYHIRDKLGTVKDSSSINLSIENLPFEDCYVETYAIDNEQNNAFTYWKQIGSPTEPTKNQIKNLQERGELTFFEPVYQIQNITQSLKLDLRLPPNSVQFIKLSNISDFTAPLDPQKLKVSQVKENELLLKWSNNLPADDGDFGSSFIVYRNGSQIASSTKPSFLDTSLKDGTNYQYKVYALDDQGNRSVNGTKLSVTTKKDNIPIEITRVFMPNETSIEIYCNKKLNLNSVKQIDNYKLNEYISLNSIDYILEKNMICLNTSRHIENYQYELELKMLEDLSSQPNKLIGLKIPYQYSKKFTDNFNTNSLKSYHWNISSNRSLEQSVKYENNKKRIFIQTGDDNQILFSKRITEMIQGEFKITFLPVKKYPQGGVFSVRLIQDPSNYYEFSNSDGYKNGMIKKYIDGIVTDSINVRQDYLQNISYDLNLNFSPNRIEANFFQFPYKIHTKRSDILIQKFEITLIQQDAFIDNICFYRNDK